MSEKHVQEANQDSCADTKKKSLKPHVPTACVCIADNSLSNAFIDFSKNKSFIFYTVL
jgi:hypothetical protein